MPELPINFLIVRNDKASAAARQLCAAISRLRVVDASDEPRSPELKRPALITPDGTFRGLSQIRLYANHLQMP